MRDHAYRATPIGEEVGRFVRAIRWGDAADNTIRAYEPVLRLLALDYAHLQLTELTTDLMQEFLDEHWGEARPSTRARNLSCVRSFFAWAVANGRCESNPAQVIRRPKPRPPERQAYPRDAIMRLISAQPLLRDQCCLRLAAQMGLRRNELRLVQVGDIDLTQSLLTVHGKGGKVVVLPIGFPSLRDALYLHINGDARAPNEFLLYPKTSRTRPMTGAAVHNWFKRCLEQAGLPASVKLHEMRHSAADEIWRVTGDIVKAQQLLRHESVGTTQAYLHPHRDDLRKAMQQVEDAWERGDS